MNYRVRFAPSPTGPLHIGAVRTALYNYFFAKKINGTFIIRIEDTDNKRFVDYSESHIKESLKWLGIEYDEGLEKFGAFAPYKQSERLDIYNSYINILIEKGLAYYCFDTEEELAICREKNESFKYDYKTRLNLKNSLVLSKNKIDEMIEDKIPYVIRFKIPIEFKEITTYDTIKGKIKWQLNELDDKVLMKSNGIPTYHFANIVDDHLMEITHVIRGEEWLPSLPFHILLYNAFDWQPPSFTHLPNILNPDGKGKLSKRNPYNIPVYLVTPNNDADKLGYKELGFLPEAVLNYLGLLGWHPGGNEEIYSKEEFCNMFSLEKLNSSGARFNYDKLLSVNKHYLMNLSNEEIYNRLSDECLNLIKDFDKYYVLNVIELIKPKVNLLYDCIIFGDYFFKNPILNDKVYSIEFITLLKDILDNKLFNFEDIEKLILNKSFNKKEFMKDFRYIVTGKTSGPLMKDTITLMGERVFSERLTNFLNKI